MRRAPKSFAAVGLSFWVSVLTCLLASAPDALAAKEKTKAPAAGAASKPSPPAEAVNACGCYKNAKGACVCTDKKGKCDCPGECEPVGCDAKREKEMEREMAAEVKRAQDDEKRRKAAEEAAERGEAVPGPDAGTSAPPESPPGKAGRAGKAKGSAKDSPKSPKPASPTQPE